jgi:hypothetical protein
MYFIEEDFLQQQQQYETNLLQITTQQQEACHALELNLEKVTSVLAADNLYDVMANHEYTLLDLRLNHEEVNK